MKRSEEVREMANRLREFHRTDGQERIASALVRSIEDPLKPRTRKGSLRINPIFVLLAALATMAVATFLFFSLVQV
jgi:hypothetical protein